MQSTDSLLSLSKYQWYFYKTRKTTKKNLTVLIETNKQTKKILNSQSILGKKNGPGESTFPDFGLCYKATVIKKVWYWIKNRNIDQWSKIEIPEINPHTHGFLIFNQGGKNIQ